MQITQVDKESVDVYWDKVKNWIHKVVKQSHGRHSLFTTYELLKKGTMTNSQTGVSAQSMGLAHTSLNRDSRMINKCAFFTLEVKIWPDFFFPGPLMFPFFLEKLPGPQ